MKDDAGELRHTVSCSINDWMTILETCPFVYASWFSAYCPAHLAGTWEIEAEVDKALPRIPYQQLHQHTENIGLLGDLLAEFSCLTPDIWSQPLHCTVVEGVSIP